MSELNAQEKEQLIDLSLLYLRAHGNRDFERSDQLRAQLMDWGAWPIGRGWHPVFESPEHRQQRLDARA